MLTRKRQNINARRTRDGRKNSSFGGLIAIIFVIATLIGQVKLHAANQELTNTRSFGKSPKTNTDLTADTKRLKDATYLQQLLRDKYGYSKQGELVYIYHPIIKEAP